ncbi:MAG: OmpA family protein [Hyphomicrobiaceae bacterium]
MLRRAHHSLLSAPQATASRSGALSVLVVCLTAICASGFGLGQPVVAGPPGALSVLDSAGHRSSAGRPPIVLVRAPRDREAEAQRMLDVIRQSLARGDIATANGQFEILQARHADTDAYGEARALMTRAPEAPARSPTVTARPAPTEAPMATERSAAAIPTPPPPVTTRPAQPGQPWTTEIRRVRALTQDFQASTGDRIFFGEASAELGSRARAVLAAQAEWLKRFPQVPIVISAHADDRGSRDYNEDLSIRRGEAVKARLMAEGIDASRMRVIPHGREARLAVCEDPGCAAQNRRVVTVIGETEPANHGSLSQPVRR